MICDKKMDELKQNIRVLTKLLNEE